jgi:hypothetical protein
MHESFYVSSHCVVNITTIKPITVAVKHSLQFSSTKPSYMNRFGLSIGHHQDVYKKAKNKTLQLQVAVTHDSNLNLVTSTHPTKHKTQI